MRLRGRPDRRTGRAPFWREGRGGGSGVEDRGPKGGRGIRGRGEGQDKAVDDAGTLQ